MGLLADFGTSKKKETEGTWVTVYTNDDGSLCRMKLTRMGQANRKFLKSYAALQKRFKVSQRDLATEAENNALMETFIDTVLMDWENVEDIREKPTVFPVDTNGDTPKLQFMDFTRPNALLLFKAIPDFYDLVVNEATKRENFQGEVLEESAKNS